MAKLSMNQLYNKYLKTHARISAKYGIPIDFSNEPYGYQQFAEQFKEYKQMAIKENHKFMTNAEVAEDMAENDLFRYRKNAVKEIQKYAKDYLKRDVNFIDIRTNKNKVTENILIDLRKEYETGKIDGKIHDSVEWKTWSASYLFGSE